MRSRLSKRRVGWPNGGHGMERGQGRRFSPQEKLQILAEGRQPGVTVSEVCRRHQIAATQFYDWERRAQEGALASLAARLPGRAPHTREAELSAEVDRLRAVVVALSTENVQLKGGETALRDGRRTGG
jgi:transposase-like protein